MEDVRRSQCATMWPVVRGFSLLAVAAGRDHQYDRGLHAGAQRRARGTRAGLAKGPIPGARRGREPHTARGGAGGRRRRPVASRSARTAPIFYMGCLLTLLAGLLFTPALSLALAKLLRGPLKWIRPVEGSLAADSLIQSPRRTSATVAALMLSLALVIAQGGLARASIDAHRRVDERHHESGLLHHHLAEPGRARFPLPRDMLERLRRIPGVDEVQPVRTARIDFRGTAGHDRGHRLAARSPARIQHHVIAGDLDAMYRLAADEKGLIVAENLAATGKDQSGRSLEIAAPAGTLRLPVVGIVRDLSNQLGTIFIERKTVRALFPGRFRRYVSHLCGAGRFAPRMCGPHLRRLRAATAACSSCSTASLRDYILKVTDHGSA